MSGSSSWWESHDLWTTFAPLLFSNELRETAAPDEVSGFVKLAGIAPGSRVCDLGSGPGRHALELARRGFRVTALDLVPAFLETLATRAREQRLDVETFVSDMRTFRREAAFDAVLSMFTTFGYFEDPADDRRVLANVRESLVPGGKLVLDVLGKECAARGAAGRYWTWLPDGLLLEERAIEREWTWMRTEWTLLRGSTRATYRLEHRLYAGAELRRLLLEVGFTKVELHGGIDGSPYDRDAWRLVAVATR